MINSKDLKILGVNDAVTCTELFRNALCFYRNRLREQNAYQGVKGSIQLAKDYGYELPNNYPVDEVELVIYSSYNSLYIEFCEFSPAIDENEWILFVRRGIEQAISDKSYHQALASLANN